MENKIFKGNQKQYICPTVYMPSGHCIRYFSLNPFPLRQIDLKSVKTKLCDLTRFWTFWCLFRQLSIGTLKSIFCSCLSELWNSWFLQLSIVNSKIGKFRKTQTKSFLPVNYHFSAINFCSRWSLFCESTFISGGSSPQNVQKMKINRSDFATTGFTNFGSTCLRTLWFGGQ